MKRNTGVKFPLYLLLTLLFSATPCGLWDLGCRTKPRPSAVRAGSLNL